VCVCVCVCVCLWSLLFLSKNEAVFFKVVDGHHPLQAPYLVTCID